MRVKALLLAAATLACVSCRAESTQPAPTPDLDRDDLLSAVLNASAVGEGWKQQKDAGPNTVQIGGRVGAASIRPLLAEATSAFDQEEGTGYVSDTVILLRSESLARTVISAHKEASSRASWKQDRDDGGRTRFTYSGRLKEIPALGDEMFAARLKADITDADGNNSEHAVEYVVFSAGPLVAFVVTQDVGASAFARRFEPRVARLLTK
jgi:hypothetical protein